MTDEQKKELLERGFKVLPEDQHQEWTDYVESSYQDKLYGPTIAVDTVELLEAVHDKKEWSEIKEMFGAQRHSGGTARGVSEDFASLAKIPEAFDYLYSHGPEPAPLNRTEPEISAEPSVPEYSEPEVNVLETFDKLTNTLSQYFTDSLKEVQDETATVSHKQQQKALQSKLDELSQDNAITEFGISRSNLGKILAYLQMDPSDPSPERQAEAKERLGEIVNAMQTHIPEGPVDKQLFEEWRARVQEASQALEQLHESWDGLSATKAYCEQERKDAQEQLRLAREKHKETKKALDTVQEQVNQKNKEIIAAIQALPKGQTLEADNPLQQQAQELHKEVKALEQNLNDQEVALSSLEETLKEKKDALIQAEKELKAKTFDVRAATMTCALQEHMAKALEHSPLLIEKTQEAQDICEEVNDLSKEYESLAQQYSGIRVAMGELMQESSIGVVQDLGNAMLDWKVSSIQKQNERDAKRDLAWMGIQASLKECVMEFGGRLNKMSSKYIELHTQNALSELKDINRIEKRIEREEKRAQAQVIRDLRRDHKKEGLTLQQLQELPEYQEKLAARRKVRTQNLQNKRDRKIKDFQKEFGKVQEAAKKRESVYKDYTGRVVKLANKIDMMRGFGDMRENNRLDNKVRGFVDDLKSLRPHSEGYKQNIGLMQDKAEQFDIELSR